MTDDLLFKYRIQHTLHSSFNILDCLIDDTIQTQVNLFTLCNRLRGHIRSYVEADNNRIGCRCQRYIGLIDRTNTTMNNFDYYFFVGQFYKALFYCLYRTLNVRLDDQRQFFYITSLNLAEQIIQRQFGLGVLQKLIFALCDEGLSVASCLFLVGSCHQDIACTRNVVQTQDLNRHGWTSLFHSAALVVHHCTDLTIARTSRYVVADTQSTFLNQNGSNRSFTLIQLCLDDKASCFTVRVCFQFFYFCCQQNHLKQLRNTFFGMCGYRYKNSASAPVLRNQFMLCQLLFYTIDIGTWLIDLVDCNDNLNPCCFCMVDCLNGLRHHAVVCCYYQNCNIGRLCTTHTHCSKCLMSRSIQECDLLTIDLYGICTDVLGDTTGLAGGNVGRTDCIQQRSLTMVNMTHNTDYRRSCNHIVLILFFLFQKLSNNINFLFFLTENIIFHRDLFCLLIIDLGVQSHNLSLQE